MAKGDQGGSTRFGQPGGNKPGVTSDQRKATIRAAEAREKAAVKAAKIQDMMLGAVVEELEKADDPAAVMMHIRADILRLVQDALDRGYGKAGASIDVTSSDGSAAMPSVIRLVGPDSDDS
jgi:hypothetical protein